MSGGIPVKVTVGYLAGDVSDWETCHGWSAGDCGGCCESGSVRGAECRDVPAGADPEENRS